MKKLAVSTIEFVLIGAFVAIVTIVFWGKISGGIINLAGLSSVKVSSTSTIKSAISGLDKNSPDYLTKRIETAGMFGSLIAQSKSTGQPTLSELASLLKSFAPDENLTDAQANACVSSPSTCSTLMTVTDFDWSTSVNMNSVYAQGDSKGDKIPVTLNYKYTYVDNNGNLVKDSTLSQSAEIQKEQNASHHDQPYSSFLNDYMSNTFDEDNFTGSAASVQKQINSYMTGTNCKLSKSDSEYVNFSQHSTTN